jgi:hypothetical protein
MMTRSTYSELLLRFAQRLGARSARTGMRSCIRSLSSALHASSGPLDIQSAMRARDVRELRFEANLSCDGYIEPLGDSFNAGFRIGVKQPTPDSIVRFTIAHELCHTFFYEVVPELKYEPLPSDPGEECLCNFGAAELLVPENDLKMDELVMYPCLTTLEKLAHRYQVSLEVMLFRLRSLHLWTCRVLRWYRLSNGSFTLEKIYGASFKDWKVWIVDEMNSVWDQPGSKKSGSCYASLVNDQGCWGSERLHYEIKRYGDHLTMLWSKRPFTPNPWDAPLFMQPAISMPLFDSYS